MNDVSLIGHLTRDPELVTTENGTEIADLRVAVQGRSRDHGAIFVSVKCFQGQARTCAEFLAKGRQIGISGRLERDEWLAKDGSKRERLYVIAQSVQFLGGKPADHAEAIDLAAEEEASEDRRV